MIGICVEQRKNLHYVYDILYLSYSQNNIKRCEPILNQKNSQHPKALSFH